MSLQAMVWALERVSDVSPPEKLLLVVLGNYAGEDWTAWPSQATLASHTGMHSRSVGSNLRKLEAAGWITRTPRTNDRGARISDIVKLNRERSAAPGDGDTPPPGENGGRPPAADGGLEPSKEPPKEPRPPSGGLAAEPARSEVRIAFDHYCELADRHGWGRPMIFTRDRQRHIRARIAEANGLKPFIAYLDDIENSPFLMGRTSGARGAFPISLDWIMKPSNFTKLMEGFYHRGRANGSTEPPGAYDPTSARNHGRTASMFAGAALAAGGRAQSHDPGRGSA